MIFSGYAYGGLSEVEEKDFISCSMGSTIAGEIGVFGHRPSVLLDMLAGKRAEVGTKVGAYMRTFSGDCSPTDLESALQVIHSAESLTSLAALFWRTISSLGFLKSFKEESKKLLSQFEVIRWLIKMILVEGFEGS